MNKFNFLVPGGAAAPGSFQIYQYYIAGTSKHEVMYVFQVKKGSNGKFSITSLFERKKNDFEKS